MKPSIMSLLLAMLTALVSSYLYIDARYALADELEKVRDRLEFKIVEDKVDSVQQRIWSLEDRYKEDAMPDAVKEDLRELKCLKNKLDMSYQVLIEKTTGASK